MNLSCNDELPAISIHCYSSSPSQGPIVICLLQFVTKRSFPNTALRPIIRLHTIKWYEGQRECGIKGDS